MHLIWVNHLPKEYHPSFEEIKSAIEKEIKVRMGEESFCSHALYHKSKCKERTIIYVVVGKEGRLSVPRPLWDRLCRSQLSKCVLIRLDSLEQGKEELRPSSPCSFVENWGKNKGFGDGALERESSDGHHNEEAVQNPAERIARKLLAEDMFLRYQALLKCLQKMFVFWVLGLGGILGGLVAERFVGMIMGLLFVVGGVVCYFVCSPR